MAISLEFLSSAAVHTAQPTSCKAGHSAASMTSKPRNVWPMLGWLLLGVIAAVAAYEFTQYALGSCQGYGGAAVAEHSIGARLGLWSIDPLTCL